MAKVVSIAALEAALAQKRRQLESLASERVALVRQLEKVDQRIALLRGNQPKVAPAPQAKVQAPKRRRRKSGGEPLSGVVARVLKEAGRPLSVKEITEAVLAAGYKTTSKDFGSVVAQYVYGGRALQRVGRGLYTLPEGAEVPVAKDEPEKAPKATRKRGRSRKQKAAAAGVE